MASTLLDTNVLLRHGQPSDPLHAVARGAIDALLADGDTLYTTPQNYYEFWATGTRPVKANGLGLTIAECDAHLGRLDRLLQQLADDPTLLAVWRELVVRYQCKGRVSYDARLVAAMRTHGLKRILTFNTGDFTRYPGLTVLDPVAVAAGVLPS
jgi:predicted nucleic acid-binding protein